MSEAKKIDKSGPMRGTNVATYSDFAMKLFFLTLG